MSDWQFLLECFASAIVDKDLEDAREYARGIYYVLAWEHNPKVVAEIGEALARLEKET